MNIRKIAVIGALVLSSFAATNVAPSKSELEGMYDKAFRDFDANNFAQALKELDAIDARQPDLAESQNLRGVILMRQGSYDKAEAALRKAIEIDPKFWNARFNLAEIPFLRKDWPEARTRFEGLIGGNSSELQAEATQLIQYKILLTYLLEGKENMIEPILNKFELSTDTPAVYYANAAVALHHKNAKEAKDWMTAADKSFSAQQNKLFAESFYEVGWMDKPAGQSRAALELTSASDRAAKAKTEARDKVAQAERAFQQRDLGGALKLLDEADAADPNQAASLNLRGEILMEQKDFDQAEAAFKKAFKADPKFREAQYNLAQIPFKKKDYAKSRDRLEALFGETPGGEKNQAAQLIKFKIFLTLLLEGKDSRAQKVMDQFKFTGDTPALYYAQAAWEFKHNNPDKANEWVASARKIYSPALNIVFADSFYDMGWLQAPATGPSPAPALAAANPEAASPAPEADANGSITLAQASPAPAISLDDDKAATSLAPKVTQSAASPNTDIASAPPLSAATAIEPPPLMPPAPLPAGSAPAAPTASATRATMPAAVASAAPSVTITSAAASVAPAAAAPKTEQQVASAATTADSVPKPDSTVAPAQAPTAAPVAADSTPATVLAPPRVREWAQPTFADTVERLGDPNTLLVGGLLLAGVVLLVWLIVQQVRRRGASVPVYRAAHPVTAPRFAAAEPMLDPEPIALTERKILGGGPPQLSLQLKASEPSVRRAAVPMGISARGAAASISPAAPSIASAKTNSPHESGVIEDDRDFGVSEPIYAPEPQPETDASTFRDKVDVSVPPVESDPAQAADETNATDPVVSPVEQFTAAPAVSDEQSAQAEALAETAAAVEPAAEQVTEASRTDLAQPEAAAVEAAPAAEPVTREGITDAGHSEEEAIPTVTPAEPSTEQPSMAAPVGAALIAALASVPHEHAAAEVEQPLVAPEEVLETSKESVPSPATEAPLSAELPEEPVASSATESIPAVAHTDETVEAAAEPEQEPVGQGQPIPYQTSVASTEPPMPEITQPTPQSSPTQPGAGLAGLGAVRPSVESPSFAPRAVSSEPAAQPPTQTTTMPEPTQTPAPAMRPPAPMTTGAVQPAGAMQTAVQLTFSLEIASLQLTPSFKMGALQLKPTSKIVTMRLAPSQHPQPAMNLQVTFEIASVQLGAGGTIAAVRLTPSQQQKPGVHTTPAFEISGLQLVSSFEAAPVQLTPSHQGQASVHMTASFNIATVEFSPSFEIASILLNSNSKTAAVQLPGTGPSSIEGAPIFEIANVQLGGNNEISLIQLSPAGAKRA
jgi:tetratricopeptide (TPR) repeat protein